MKPKEAPQKPTPNKTPQSSTLAAWAAEIAQKAGNTQGTQTAVPVTRRPLSRAVARRTIASKNHKPS